MMKSQLHVRPEYPWQKKGTAQALVQKDETSEPMISETDSQESGDIDGKYVIDTSDGIEKKDPAETPGGMKETSDDGDYEEVIVLEPGKSNKSS